jgi:hypothetical protein
MNKKELERLKLEIRVGLSIVYQTHFADGTLPKTHVQLEEFSTSVANAVADKVRRGVLEDSYYADGPLSQTEVAA